MSIIFKNMNLKSKIRKKLIESQTNQEETKKIITENLKSAAVDYKFANYNEFIKNIFKVSKKVSINESANDMFDTYFTKLFKGQEGKVKTELTNFVSTNLNLPSGLKSYFEDKMNSVSDDDVASLFTDSNKISDILVDAIVEESKDSGSEPSDIMDVVQNVITSNMDSQETRYKLKKAIKKLIEKLMDERKSKIESMVKEIMSQVAEKAKESKMSS
jgi:hypothetical protein